MRPQLSPFLLLLSQHIHRTTFAATIQSAYITANQVNSIIPPAHNSFTSLNQTNQINLTQKFYQFLENGNLLELDTSSLYLPQSDIDSVLKRTEKTLGKKPGSTPLGKRERFEIGADRTAEPYNEVVFVIEPIYEQTFTWSDAYAAVEGLIEWFKDGEQEVDRNVTTYFLYQDVPRSVPRSLGYGAVKRTWQPFPPGVEVNVTESR